MSCRAKWCSASRQMVPSPTRSPAFKLLPHLPPAKRALVRRSSTPVRFVPVGYAIGDRLLYATGGLAWSDDRFTRTQVAGSPVGGTATPGTSESSLHTRVGWAAGAGIEFLVALNWTANFEYLLTEFGPQTVVFPAGAQRFKSDLEREDVRFGLNYQFGDDLLSASGITAPKSNVWSIHGQTTFVDQSAPRFGPPTSAKTVSYLTRPLRPGTLRFMRACTCGTAPSFGSTQRSTKASV